VTSARRLTAVLTSAFAILAIAIGIFASTIPGSAVAQEKEQEQDASTPDASPSASPSAADVAFTFAVDAEQSTVRYRAMEELSGIGANEAVGETQAIIGTLLFDNSYVPLAGSRIDVDLRTLVSDETRRDNFLYDNVLETGEFPLATFIVTGVDGLDAGLPDGEEVTFQLIGDLTLHGVTNPATWEVTAKRDGDSVTGTANTDFVLEDYEMEKPIVGPVVSIDDDIKLEIDVVAAAVEA
jgi:polyisoprenoid-binding protein YceI